jgi:ergothioneine biosynthesis protein EgtB
VVGRLESKLSCSLLLHELAARTALPEAPLAERYAAIRTATEALSAPLSAEDCTIQSMADASPVKWHLAHTSWFFETFVLAPHRAGYALFDPAFRVLFNSYYNAVGDKHPRPQRGLLSRPSLESVRAYRRHVDRAMEELFPSVKSAELADLIELGINHEQQHQELILTDLKHMLSCNPLRPVYAATLRSVTAPAPTARGWIEFEERLTEIGHEPPGFAFDNETPRHREFVPGFALAPHPVSNAEYLEFMRDGGYRRSELWLSEGWDWVSATAVTAPFYWERDGNTWKYFTLGGMLPLEPEAPVCHVSLYEADAYARWAGARLPTEGEWEVAARDLPIAGNFVEDGWLRPRRPTDSPGALQQMFGDVWEWTQSAYAPYPGFRPAAGAVSEYNGKFMCNQYVLRGGSCATPRSHIRATYRNFFPAAARWQFTGIRLARDA